VELRIPSGRRERLAQLDELQQRLLRDAPPSPGHLQWQGLSLRYTHPTVLYHQIEQIFYKRQYQVDLPPGPVRILDCGGNIGLSALYYKWRYPECRLTVFEADPKLADMLAENLARNGIDDVTLIRAAVAGCPGEVTFYRDGQDAGRIHRQGAVMVGQSATAVRVPAVCLSDYLDEAVDLLKLDVEGAELEILEESRGALARVGALALEYHGFSEEPQALHRILTLLDGAGYRYFPHQVVYHEGGPPDRLSGAAYMMLIYAIRTGA